ncbi:unnamed protein product [Owenia fusiformis]|uniref:Uncharacterized protein n=1 Tax=Owenia fusiformis TaxID=6347 RepID=A0A8J1TT89_OWEFU|nr:unnamed protein product [Owenia fusiformis]
MDEIYKWTILALVAVLSLIGVAESSCEYGGTTFATNHTFLKDDMCNDCTCLENTKWRCTTMNCSTFTCSYGNQIYNLGDRFGVECNTCDCQRSGALCSNIDCYSSGTSTKPVVVISTLTMTSLIFIQHFLNL